MVSATTRRGRAVSWSSTLSCRLGWMLASSTARRLPVALGQARTEVGEDVELGVQSDAALQMLRVAARPTEGLAVGVLDPFRVDPAVVEVRQHLRREVAAHHRHYAGFREEAGAQRSVGGGAAHHVACRGGGELEVVEGHRADDESRVRRVHAVPPAWRANTGPSNHSSSARARAPIRSRSVMRAPSRARWAGLRSGSGRSSAKRAMTCFGERRVLAHHRDDGVDGHGLHALMPGIVVRGERQGRVGQLGFACELGLGQGSHSDHAHSPASIKVALGAGRELGALDADVRAVLVHRGTGPTSGARDPGREHGAHRIREGHVGHHVFREERADPPSGEVQVLIDHHEMPGDDLLPHRADG